MDIKITSSHQTSDEKNCEISIGGLTKEQLEIFKGFILGMYWLNIDKDGLNSLPALAELPRPAADESIMPYWSSQDKQRRIIQTKLFSDGEGWPPFSPSFVIQHLCGYNYSPENYKYQVEKLESYGFECLRSHRGPDGKFWEIWFLPGTFCAKGVFKDELDKIENMDEKEILERAISFLCRNVSFGTLDVVIQRAAMVIDEG